MRKVLVGLLMGGFCSLMAAAFEGKATTENDEEMACAAGLHENDPDSREAQILADEDFARKLQESLRLGDAIPSATAVIALPIAPLLSGLVLEAFPVDITGSIVTDFSRISVEGMSDIISYKGKNYPEKFKHVWAHDYERKGSVRHTQRFIQVDGKEKFIDSPISLMFRHIEERPLGDNLDALWVKKDTYRKTLHRTTNHGKRNLKNCWNNCNVNLTVEIRSLIGVFNGVDEIVDQSLTGRNLSLEIQGGGRQWCTKQNPYNARYEAGIDTAYFREAFPDLSKFFN